MALGDRIKEIRQSLGWTQDQLAKEAQISKSFLSEVENNKSNVSGDKLLKIERGCVLYPHCRPVFPFLSSFSLRSLEDASFPNPL